jgi:hypothetical protein
MIYVDLRTNVDFSLYSINLFVCMGEMTGVYCAVRRGSLSRTTNESSSKGLRVLRDCMKVSSHVDSTCKYVDYSNMHVREVPHVTTVDYKGKTIVLQAWTGSEGPRRLRLPDFKTVGKCRW